MDTANVTRQTVEAHLSLQGWIPLVFWSHLGYWGVWNSNTTEVFYEDIHGGQPIRLAKLKQHWVPARPTWDQCKEIEWDRMPDLSFKRFADIIILGKT